MKKKEEKPAVVLDPLTLTVEVKGQKIPLTVREWQLLYLLNENAGEVITKGMIEETLGWSERGNIIVVYVSYLRGKIGAGRIESIRGEGYMLTKEAA